MNYCININNPLYQLEIARLTKILGDSNAAIAALELNNGYSMDKTNTGEADEDFNLIIDMIKLADPELPQSEVIRQATIEKINQLNTARENKTVDDLFNVLDELSNQTYSDAYGRHEFISKFHDHYYIPRYTDVDFTTLKLNELGRKYRLPDGYYRISKTQNGRLEINLNKRAIKDYIARQATNTLLSLQFDTLEVGQEAIDTLTYLSNKTGLQYQIITEDQASKLLHKEVNPSINAFVVNGICYFIQGRQFSSDIAAEEMLHPFVQSIKKYNPEAFASLLANAQSCYPKLRLEIDGTYTTDQDEELVTQALARAYRQDVKTVGRNKNKIVTLLKSFIDYVLNIFESNFGENEYIINARRRFDEILEQKSISVYDLQSFITISDLAQVINSELEISGMNTENSIRFNESPDRDQDTLDLVALMQYQYSKEGLTQDEINQRIKAFLNNDKQEVNTVKKFVDFVQIRQAQLHTLGKDFGAESYTANGFFDWSNYLKGIDLRHDITEEDDLSAFEPITDYVIEPAEIIIPKIYKSQFKLGNYDIADIDENFFKKVNPFYDCSLKPSKSPDLSQAKIDVLVRTHTSNYNVIIKDDLSAPIEGLTRVESRIEDGWRLSLSGKRMYQIPLDLIFEIYKDKNGVETLVIKNGEGVEKSVRKLISSTENLVSVQLFLENIKPTEDWINFAITNNNINSNNQILKQIKRRIVNNEANDDAIRGDLSMLYYDHRNKVRYKNDLASTLYNSFVKSLYLVSVRIPTQAFQSIMATKASALTNDDSNNVFVTRWQFWLQGSDLDIDKTYLMGVDISSIGTFNHWSPLADYTTRSLADISDQLPVPNGFELVFPSEYWKTTENPMVIKFDSNMDSRINTIILNYLNLDEDDNKREERLKTIVDLLNYINKNQEFSIAPDLLQDYRVKQLINLINKHNTHKVTGEEARNIIQRNILRASLDERNMKASYSPIDVVMKKFQNELDKIADLAALERNLNDGGLSIARAQYNNSVGKKDVGIMANGLKAFFALTHYFNKYRKDPNFVNSTRYFLTKISLGTGKDKYFSTISDIKFEESALAILENAFRVFCPELFVDTEGNPITGPHLTFSDDDASLLISSLVSLATDNAKELALAKMNASIDLACMHLFLVVMGYNAEDVVKFTTSQAFSKVASILSKSKFDSKSLNVRDAIGLALEGVEMGTDDEYQLRQMLFIYNCAQEMSTIAKIAAINQGVKVDELDSDKFFQNVSDVISTQVNALSDEGFKLVINPANKRRFLVTEIKKLIQRTHNIDNPSETLIQRYAEKLESVNQRNEQYGYIDGSLKIDLLRYYRDTDYKQFIIDFYDIFKHNFNVLDCIDNLAHFNKMLEAFVLAESTILQHSSRARAVLQESRRAYQGDRVYNYLNKQESDGENTWTRKIKLFDRVNFSDAIKRKASKFYDDYILSEWIKEFGQNYEITYEDEDGNIVELKLRNNQDIAKFANFIAYELIPILKEVYPKNTFLHYIKPDFKLIRKGSKELYLPRYVFNFDIDTLTTVQDQNKAFYVNNGFDELSSYTLNNVGIKTTKGGSIKLGELLYLYDRLVSSSIGQSSLDRAFDLYLSKIGKDSIASQIASIELDHDTGKRPEIHFDPLLFTAFCYSSVIRAKQNGVMVYDYDRKAKTKQELSIKEKYLFNLESIEEHKDGLLKAEEFLEAIKNGSIEASLSDSVWTLTSTVNSDIYYEFAGGNDYSINGFINDLITDKQINGDAINDFINQLQELPKPSFKGYQTLQVYKTFQKNMSKIGVQVEIVDDPEIKNGYVKDGVIYLNKRSSITTTPMHELLHLVFGVMKYDNFDNYQRLMELLYTSKEIQNIYSELNQSEQYQNLMDLDKKEEAFCRAIEAVINGRLQSDNLFTDGTNDFYDTVKTMLNPIIGKTFGIEAPTELINFLNDTVGNLKGYNSTLFMPIKSDSTGYLDSKAKIIQSTKISAFIEKMVKDGVLIETEC